MGPLETTRCNAAISFIFLFLGLSYFAHNGSAIRFDVNRLENQEKLVVRLPRNMAPPGTNSLNAGGCSLTPVLLTVSSENDFNKRLTIPISTTVYLYLSGDVTLTKPLNMSGPEWSCTSIRPLNSGSNPTLIYPDDDKPAVLIWNTNNVFMFGVSIRIAATDVSPACIRLPDFAGVNSCPALFIWRSYSIKIFSGSIYGRTDVTASTTTHIDSMILFAPGFQVVNQTRYPGSVSCPGVIRFLYCGDPVNLVRSDNIISNSDISGNSQGVILYYMAVGVTVRNNEIHNFSMMGIQCGMNIHNVADCMLNTISNNLIYTESFVNYWGDGAGIYFDTHYINPGNVVSCNHVKGGRHCIYIDYASSGVRVDGGICEGTQDGIKINNGKNNVATSLVHYKVQYTVGIVSCQNPDVNNCNRDPGSYWMNTYNQFYRSPEWDQIAPYLINLCDQTTFNGYQCNPPNSNGSDPSVTGKCSGLPTGNSVQHIIVDGSKMNPPYYAQCQNFTTVPQMNPVTSFPVTGNLSGFDNLGVGDFGVSDFRSPIYNMIPNFKSCPKSSIGIQRQSVQTLSSQMLGFNAAQPTVQLASFAFKSTFKAQFRAAEFHDYKLLTAPQV